MKIKLPLLQIDLLIIEPGLVVSHEESVDPEVFCEHELRSYEEEFSQEMIPTATLLNKKCFCSSTISQFIGGF